MNDENFIRMGGGHNASLQGDSELKQLFLVQLKAIKRLDNECGSNSTDWCGNCYAGHQMERFDAAIDAIKKLRAKFQIQYGGLL